MIDYFSYITQSHSIHLYDYKFKYGHAVKADKLLFMFEVLISMMKHPPLHYICCYSVFPQFSTCVATVYHMCCYSLFCIPLHVPLQCPYLIYVEVLESEGILSAPVPVRIPESQLRSSHSDEDFCPSPTSYTEPAVIRNLIIPPMCIENGDIIDDQDCWSQDDDDLMSTVSPSCLTGRHIDLCYLDVRYNIVLTLHQLDLHHMFFLFGKIDCNSLTHGISKFLY